MSYTAYLATRYLFGKHRIPFIAFIARTTIVGMALGVTTLILALGIMRGFESVVTQKIIGFDTHIRIEKLFESGFDLSEETVEEIANIGGVDQVFRIRKAELMLKANDITQGALLEAMPMDALKELYSVSSNLNDSDDAVSGIILGAALAEQMKLEVGETVLLYDLGSFTEQSGFPSIAHAPVQAIYESGMVDYDKSYLYCSLETMDEILGQENASNEYGIFLTDLALTDEVIHEIDELLPYSYLSISWKDRHQTLFNWMKTQQLPIFVIFSMIMLVALVNIASTLILIIMEKRSEIGTLRALGTSKARIRRVFALEGLMIGISGVALGLFFSAILTWLQSSYGLISLPADVYFMDSVSIQIAVDDVLLISAGIIGLAILSSLIPAMQASQLKPADALRDE